MTGRTPSELYRELTERYGDPAYARIDTRGDPGAEGGAGQAVTRSRSRRTELAGEQITAVLTTAPGNGAPIGGLKVVTESGWFAARPSGHRGRLQALRRVLPRPGAPGRDPGRGPGHRGRRHRLTGRAAARSGVPPSAVAR